MKLEPLGNIIRIIFFLLVIPYNLNSQTITGESKQYHKTTITFDALSLSEAPATYLDYRMNVTITAPSSATYVVPAYFAADGNAAETSATSGDKWRCHFTPKEIGTYNYTVSFRTGNDIVADLSPTAGTPTSINGNSGSFTITSSDKTGDDFRAKGKLQYVGEKAAKFDNGSYYLEVGTDSPETFLEYGDFDATTARHDFAEVANNYVNGDPSWQGGKGTEIIGAVNYLANQGMNIHYLLTMNITGDGTRAYPFPTNTAYTTYDVSKLDQWQIVFDHMYNKGIALEMVFTEQENLNWFEMMEGSSTSGFGIARKLYYREMIARFGYLNVIYNIGEEANEDAAGDVYTAQQIEDAAEFVQDLAPYNDLITVHNGPSSQYTYFNSIANLSGTNHLTAISRQGDWDNVSQSHTQFATINNWGENDGTKWVLRLTEPYANSLPDLDTWTNVALWGSITGGAVGIHYYSYNGDIGNDDYTDYAGYYSRMKYAKDFFEDNNIPFWNMDTNDANISDGYLLTDNTDYFVGYLPNGGSRTITILGSDTYTVKWFDPRNGGALQDGSVTSLAAGTNVSLGTAPNNTTSSWVVYLKKENNTVGATGVTVSPENTQVLVGATTQLAATITPTNATNNTVTWSSSNNAIATVDNNGVVTGITQGNVTITATTNDGGFTDTATVTVNPQNNTIGVTGVTVSPENTQILVGATAQLTATITPTNATNTDVSWSSSNNSIATVDNNGLVTGVVQGNVTITATTNDGGFTDTAIITVIIDSSCTDINLSAINDFPNINITGFAPGYRDNARNALAIDASIYKDQFAAGTTTFNGSTGTYDLVINTLTETDGESTYRVFIDDVLIGTFQNPTTTTDYTPASQSFNNITVSNGAAIRVEFNSNTNGNIPEGNSTAYSRGRWTSLEFKCNSTEPILITGVTVSPENTQVLVGATTQLAATITPTNATNNTVTWSSSNNAIATVDNNGLVTGVAQGNVTITATTIDGGFTDTATVAVNPQNNTVGVTGVTVSPENTQVLVGATAQLTATITPTNATNTDVSWSSSNNSIATVDNNGLVTGVVQGNVTITATTNDGGFTDTAIITVIIDSSCTDINLSAINDFPNINITGFAPGYRDNARNALAIDASIYKDQFAAGTTTFNGSTGTYDLVINTLTETDGESTYRVFIDDVLIGTFQNPTTTTDYTPASQSFNNITVSNGAVIRVEFNSNTNGNIPEGNSTAYSRGRWTSLEFKCNSTEPILITGVTVSPENTQVLVGATTQLAATITPTNATNNTVTWSSSNNAIATVDNNGVVTGITQGNVTITATTNDGGFTDTATVTVNPQNNTIGVTGVTVSPENTQILVGATAQLTATITPTNATNTDVSWSSSNNSIATVDNNGLVTGVVQGNVTITATTNDGGFTDTAIITVIIDSSCTDINLSAINDFPNINITGFAPGYRDNARNALAIDASIYKDQFAAGTTTFNGSTGTYDLVINTLTETDGESTYRVFIDDVLIGTFQNPTTTTDYTPASQSFNNITVSNGAVIRVEFNSNTNGNIPEGNSTAYSRGRWTSLEFKCNSTEPILITGVTVSPENTQVLVGATTQLAATITPTNATNNTVTWSSSNNAIATVDNNGVVTGITQGNVTITATTNDGGFTDTATVTVNPQNNTIGVTGVTVSPENTQILVGATAQLTATITPTNATNTDVSWSSSNNSIATVDNNGLVTGVVQGNVTITATTNDGGFTDTAIITVIIDSSCTDINLSAINDFPNINITGFAPGYRDNARNALAIDASIYKDQFAAGTTTFNGSTGTYDLVINTLTETDGESTYRVFIDDVLIGTFQNPTTTTDYTPASQSFNNITVSNGAVIRVEFNSNTNGNIPEGNSTAYSRGRWTSLEFKCNSTEPILITGVTVSPENTQVLVGATTQLAATITPTNATNNTVTWSSSNNAIATVDNNGVVTGITQGNVTITATTNDGGFTDTATVTVNPQNNTIGVTGVTVSPENTQILVGATAQLTATITPTNATNTDVSWSSSNNSIATVDNNGLVTGVVQGNVTITATTNDGGFTDTAIITVIIDSSCTDINLSAINDFPNINITGFAPGYRDNARNALAIDASIYKDQFAAGTTTFNGSTGTYDLVINTLTETDGESTYRVFIDDVLIGTFQNPTTTTDYTPASQSFNNITVSNGAVIRVEFNSNTNGNIPGGYSRGRWTSLEFKCSSGNTTPIPVTGITVSPENTQILVGATIQLAATITPTNATNTAVSWSSSNNAVATVDANGIVTGDSTGTVTITATTNDGGFSKSVIVNFINDGNEDIVEDDLKINFKVFPNPTNSSDTVYISGLNEDSYTVSLFDLVGKLIKKRDITFNNRTGEFRISFLKSGMYFLTVGNENSLYSTKLIVK